MGGDLFQGDLCPGRPHQGTASPFPRAAWLLSAPDSAPLRLADAWGPPHGSVPAPTLGGSRRRRASGSFLLLPALGALLTAAPVEGLSAQVTLVSLGPSVGPPSALTSLGLSKAVLTVTHSLHLGTLSPASLLPARLFLAPFPPQNVGVCLGLLPAPCLSLTVLRR